MKIAYIDVETTGTNWDRNGLTQFAALLEIDGRIVDELNLHIQPMPEDVIEKEALGVTGKTLEEVMAYPAAEIAYHAITDTLLRHIKKYDRSDKFFFTAYNAPFDSQFVRAFLNKNGDQWYGSYFWHPPICVMNLAAHKLRERRKTLPNFKLTTVAEALGIQREGQAHDALYDIQLTRDVYQALLAS